ncbi:type IV secretion system protein VirB10 [Variovorax boronicumulans]|uniref:type IV secretion system protein VirB10 n=1 Tax=Variovorax boronicumulans TaxID=436515 RepID=UPI002476E7DC|nr:type IV secretion system protein VirB10 [Variovorax boronicumulans]MDH6170014.1 type IV secretion system protein VirB10 [Variovorax boronicumulans]
MTWIDQPRRGARIDPPTHSDASEIDPETGEILPGQTEAVTGNAASRIADERATVRGERAMPSVNRERSVQSRISGFLALAVIILLGGGFLFWYYNTQYAKTREAEEAARKAASARAGGEMKVPPLGRIDPPQTPPQAPPIAGTPAAPSTAAVNTSPSQKTPAQIALERQLGTPVLRRAQSAQPSGISAPHGFADPAALPAGGMPGMSQLFGALQPLGAGSAASGGGGQLAANLRPTPTPAVLAQTLPTRRMLLPKGAFIDCTLETAIDSTYEGMTTCIGASDIYGADGKVVLLERGTKYVGEQRGTPRQGQGRVFIVWNEARTPTGVVVQLASPGTDELGRSGLPGFVDTHFWDRFGAAVLISVIDGTMQAIAAQQQSGTRVGSGGGLVLGPQGSRDVMTEVLRSTVSIPPTVIKNQGERIQILVARDVDFRSVYALRSDPAHP